MQNRGSTKGGGIALSANASQGVLERNKVEEGLSQPEPDKFLLYLRALVFCLHLSVQTN